MELMLNVRRSVKKVSMELFNIIACYCCTVTKSKKESRSGASGGSQQSTGTGKSCHLANGSKEF